MSDKVQFSRLFLTPFFVTCCLWMSPVDSRAADDCPPSAAAMPALPPAVPPRQLIADKPGAVSEINATLNLGGTAPEIEVQLAPGPVVTVVEAGSTAEIWVSVLSPQHYGLNVSQLPAPTPLTAVATAEIGAARAYFGDSEGNVWRLRIPSLPSAPSSNGLAEGFDLSVIASLGGDVNLGFEASPVVVHAFDAGGAPFDGVLLRGLWRNASGVDVQRVFYLRDYEFAEGNRSPGPITIADLSPAGIQGDGKPCELSRCRGWWTDVAQGDIRRISRLLVEGGRVLAAISDDAPNACIAPQMPREVLGFDLRTGRSLEDREYLYRDRDAWDSADATFPSLPASDPRWLFSSVGVVFKADGLQRIYWRDLLIDQD